MKSTSGQDVITDRGGRRVGMLPTDSAEVEGLEAVRRSPFVLDMLARIQPAKSHELALRAVETVVITYRPSMVLAYTAQAKRQYIPRNTTFRSRSNLHLLRTSIKPTQRRLVVTRLNYALRRHWSLSIAP